MKIVKVIFCIISFVCLLLLTGCEVDGLKVDETNNPKVSCTVLFEYDGVRVYRFFDSEYHYFAKVVGTESVKTVDDYTTSTGKTTIYHHNSIETVK